ncbi:tetratricopeptide repeat protein [Spirochaetota bacterium]
MIFPLDITYAAYELLLENQKKDTVKKLFDTHAHTVHDPYSLLLIARFYALYTDEFDMAAKILHTISDNLPGDSHVLIGYMYQRESNMTNARHHYEKALQHSPHKLYPAVNLMLLLLESGKHDKCISLLAKTEASFPENYYLYIIHALIALKQKDYRKAEKYLTLSALYEESPFQSMHYYLYYSMLYEKKEEYKTARQYLAMAREIDPFSAILSCRIKRIDDMIKRKEAPYRFTKKEKEKYSIGMLNESGLLSEGQSRAKMRSFEKLLKKLKFKLAHYEITNYIKQNSHFLDEAYYLLALACYSMKSYREAWYYLSAAVTYRGKMGDMEIKKKHDRLRSLLWGTIEEIEKNEKEYSYSMEAEEYLTELLAEVPYAVRFPIPLACKHSFLIANAAGITDKDLMHYDTFDMINNSMPIKSIVYRGSTPHFTERYTYDDESRIIKTDVTDMKKKPSLLYYFTYSYAAGNALNKIVKYDTAGKILEYTLYTNSMARTYTPDHTLAFTKAKKTEEVQHTIDTYHSDNTFLNREVIYFNEKGQIQKKSYYDRENTELRYIRYLMQDNAVIEEILFSSDNTVIEKKKWYY